ncbi:UDP-N-acetylglucosamine 1-carboxyvinyltransferase [Gluconacetobacter entanii]|jgi:UDP-N-acetylglucosamine 1-carboxyvinyltransferase|uniref:UDP-N-acetylglucosamine 1-carboxyvinyltransferase n=1 Tax=Gluconacetobacter entanii TaxID=108528 RepID=A0ABT3K7K4_9PROT|nr:UDP-N-acetylglucosamine 1-carboxyvinyltransferase [Gluconacetobacter entanii]MBY4639796.1 UDP-N-acetylglucosamine 1-carboxyvinyltransferase [Gluconacetobacter entanii]MCW4580663.1 UDP-N-acetylglucosamine 1-carboxyvinyltransferase [Gluconacetobacter entanii]MCW4583947.1 UDP-N-acetylglucosamine 1-carboxyvinyltransferase [Gluconacetobacter entanii]MCW4587337.1 UDP-N-acetylglucosamine 1-carboxyvinyltransferase [Gluconacetobacter entanii]MCW4591405.1 UDP-N-acetylglucosamine 1-carboxyvinyltransfe
MDRFIIRGGHRLHGDIVIGGAKNSALKLLVAGLLTSETLVLSNVPRIADIRTMRTLLQQHGLTVEDVDGTGAVLSVGGPITNTEAPYNIVSKMRASILVLGPLLARCGEARVSLPGGCAIGTRPVDMHLKGLEALGARITLENGYINAQAPEGLTGARIILPFASVGATENLLMASCLAKGRTEIVNAAREPEIGDLVACLNAMGARITGAGSGTLVIDGVDALHGAEYRVMPDRIECGTYACAAAITGGDLRLIDGRAEHLGAVVRALEEAGAEVFQEEDALRVRRTGALRGVDIMTEPYPGFPTDMQAQFMALLSVAEGASMVTETIFENRFMHVPELNRMGARINVHGSSAIIRGVHSLSGAPVMATDLRASFSLILAGLAAHGETILSRVYHLDRGYEAVERKLARCGAQIERVSG